MKTHIKQSFELVVHVTVTVVDDVATAYAQFEDSDYVAGYGSARRHPDDKDNAQYAISLASSRALVNAGRRTLRSVFDEIHQKETAKQAMIQAKREQSKRIKAALALSNKPETSIEEAKRAAKS